MREPSNTTSLLAPTSSSPRILVSPNSIATMSSLSHQQRKGKFPANAAIRKPRHVIPRPLHSRDSPRLQAPLSSGEWQNVVSIASDSAGGTLARDSLERLLVALDSSSPLIIHQTAIAKAQLATRNSWVEFLAQDEGVYQVNEGAKTDRHDGASVHCPGLLTLRQIWLEPRRMEVGLKIKERGDGNPVIKWLQQRRRAEPTLALAGRLLAQLRSVLSGARGRSKLLEPAFVAGSVRPGGGPTHFDDYDNLALVLVGRKTFYVAPPSTFRDSPRLGKSNERKGVSPHDRLTSDMSQWQVAHLQAGDILYLPKGWWHYVDSIPQKVMTNVWARTGV